MDFIKSKTNDDMWVRKDSEDCFTIVSVTLYEDYCISELEIDLNVYSEDLERYVEEDYGSVEKLKAKFPNDWKQITAESIALDIEADKEFDEFFEDEDEVSEHLKENYNIKYYENA